MNGKEDGRTLTRGTGKPVDELDTACKRLYQCYMCAQADHGESCNYVSTRYDKSNNFDTVTGAKSIECNETPGTCEMNLCQCDRAFAEEYANSINNGVYNPSNHQENDFDPYDRDNCAGPQGTPLLKLKVVIHFDCFVVL